MTTQPNDGGPAFPTVDTDDPGRACYTKNTGMTLRQYAAIKLRVPDSGVPWLDEMICQSLRDDFAAKAMQGMGASEHWSHNFDSNTVYLSNVASIAYEMADAMLAARSQPTTGATP